ncbi:MAG TPA: flagellin [Devosiaceae bacterium]
MSDITLSAAVRQNLLSLQNTASLMATTQNRLATGNKVNSALDNPSSFFTAQGLNNRAGDFSNLLDSMSNGIQVLDAANNGLTSITKTLQSMQSTLQQARADSSFQAADYTLGGSLTGSDVLTLSGGAFSSSTTIALGGSDAASSTHAALTGASTLTTIDLSAAANDLTFDVNGQTVTLAKGAAAGPNGDGTYTASDVADLINSQVGTSASVSASVDAGKLVVTSTSTVNNGADDSVTIDNFSSGDASQLGYAAAASATTTGTNGVYTVDELVSKINNSYSSQVTASNDGGKLRLTNLSATALTVDGATSTGTIDGSTTGSNTVSGNTVRSGLVDQFNTLRDQLDKTASDASFNGINILNGDDLKITFNESGTSTIDIQSNLNGAKGTAINSANLGVDGLAGTSLDANTSIDGLLSKVSAALNTVRAQSSNFGSNLAVVQNRQDFTKSMINTLQTGASNLTLADSNEEAANMLALQTRQQLSTKALSLASQADQNILQLLR